MIEAYGKIPRSVADQLDLMALGLLTYITTHIDRRTNQLQRSLSALCDACGISTPTLTKYTRILEQAGFITVKRKPGGKHDDTNIYSLSGIVAEVALCSAVKNFDGTGQNTLEQGLNIFTGGVKNFYTDNIDIKRESIREEDSLIDSSTDKDSNSGEFPMTAEGQDSTLPQQDAPLRKLEILGITGPALEAAKLFPERVDKAIALSQQAWVDDPSSYASRVLMNGVFADHAPVKRHANLPDRKRTKNGPFDGMAWSDFAHSDDRLRDKNADLRPPSAHSRPPTASSAPDSRDSAHGNVYVRAWAATLNFLELQLDRGTFKRHLDGTQVVRTETKDYCTVIGVNSAEAQDFLQHRFYRNLINLFRRYADSPAAEIRFEVNHADPEPNRSELGTERKWQATYNQLELQLDRQTFESCVRGAQFISLEAGIYCVRVKDAYARDMLQHRLYRNVRRTLSSVTGKHTEIRFLLPEELPEVQA